MAQELARIADEANRASGSGQATAIRYMGNELAVVYEGMGRKEAAAAARLIQVRFSAIDLSALTKDPALRLSLSLGIVLSPEHGSDAAELIKLSAGLPLEGRARGGSLVLFPEDIVARGAEEGLK
jgi:GGDEF domain-containing protein